jgi:hypothetical protein
MKKMFQLQQGTIAKMIKTMAKISLVVPCGRDFTKQPKEMTSFIIYEEQGEVS